MSMVWFVLGISLAVLVVAIGGVVAMVWPFLAAMRVSVWEFIGAVLR